MMTLQWLLLLIGASTLCAAWDDCSGQPNLHPIATDPPKFVKAVEHGKLFLAGNVEPPIRVVHVSGTPYEMGYAHGKLLREEILMLVPQVVQYMEKQIQPYVAFLPEWLQQIIEELGIEAALDATYALTWRYISNEWKDEIQVGFVVINALVLTAVVRA